MVADFCNVFFFHFISPQLITYNKANKIRRFFGVAIVGHEKICMMHNNFPLGMFWHQKKTKKNAKKCEWCWADFWQHSFTATEKEGLKKVRMSHLWICKPKWHICHLGVWKKKVRARLKLPKVYGDGSQFFFYFHSTK